MDAQQDLSKGLELVTGALDKIAADCQERYQQLVLLEQKIEDGTTELDSITKKISAQEASFQRLIAQQAQALEAEKSKLAKVTDELRKVEDDLTQTKQKHTQFVAYQVRAEKALKAREQSILEREKALEEAIGQAKRRVSILGSIS